MPAERVSMRKIRDVLRLTHAMGMSRRLVGEATGIGKSAVGDYVRRAAIAGFSWPVPDGIDDVELERRLFPPLDVASTVVRSERADSPVASATMAVAAVARPTLSSTNARPLLTT